MKTSDENPIQTKKTPVNSTTYYKICSCILNTTIFIKLL